MAEVTGRASTSNTICQPTTTDSTNQPYYNKGLINIWPAAGDRKAVAAIISEEAIKAGLPMVNAYVKSVGEEPLEGTIREIITGKRSEKKSPLSSEELRKFARMHKQADNS